MCNTGGATGLCSESVTELLERIRTEVDQRLAVLRPSVDEYQRLLRGAEALSRVAPLGGGAGAGAGSQAAVAPVKPARRTRRAKPRPAKKAARARPGQTQLRVIEVLRTHPGSTSTQVAKAMGISTNAAAATISRLFKQGRVQRRNEGGYVTAEPAAAPPTDIGVEPEPVEPTTEPASPAGDADAPAPEPDSSA